MPKRPEMSTTVVGVLAEPRTLESGPDELNDCLPWFTIPTSDDQTADTSGETGDLRLFYDAACEIQLVSAAKSGDQRAFVELCRRYTPLLKRRIWRMVRNREDSEDILQDTLLRAYKNLLGFQAKCAFSSWIMTIAINNSLMLLRKRRNHPESGMTCITTDGEEIEIPGARDSLPNPEEAYLKRHESHRIAEAMKMLPAGFRQVLERYHQDEVRLVDAAKAIGITVGAAKSRLLRARRALRSHLKRENLRNPGR